MGTLCVALLLSLLGGVYQVMPTLIDAPAPGLQEGVPAPQYHAWNAVSNSMLSAFREAPTPAHFRHAQDHPKKTDSLTLGDAAHLSVLQPDLFGQKYAVATQCEANTKEGKRCSSGGSVSRAGKWYCGRQGHDPGPAAGAVDDRMVIGEEDRDRCVAMRNAVYAHPTAAALLLAPGPREASFCWPDKATGLLRCGRADKLAWLSTGQRIVVDLKTTEDASPAWFARHAKKYGYHRQAAGYLDGLAELGDPHESFVLIVVESGAPHGVAVYRLLDVDLDEGRKETRELLNRIKPCLETGEWPGYPTGVQDLLLPEWA